MTKDIELIWPGKERTLLYIDDRGRPVWGGDEDLRGCGLKELGCYGKSSGGNLLIEGENLFALKALEPELSGAVKCVYIDPPYNTGGGHRRYHDSLPSGLWLSMMKPRLEALKDFLSDDGFIFVHIDSSELGHLRVLMDELFGGRNFLCQICWQRSPRRTVLGQGRSPIITILEYILVYAKDRSRGRLKKLVKRVRATERVMAQYRVLFRGGKKRLVRDFCDERSGAPVRIWTFDDFYIKTLPAKTTKSEYIELFDELYQSVSIHKEHTFLQRVLGLLSPTKAYLVEYVPRRGKRAGRKVEQIFYRGRRLLPAGDHATVGEDSEIYRLRDMDNLWTDDEIGVTGSSGEGGADLRRGKKPESLLKRVLEISTEPGDLVLDAFLGSGTTSAVAHKTGRRWVGIERNPHIFKSALERLISVVDGRDTGGVSRETGWRGGGGFRHLVVERR